MGGYGLTYADFKVSVLPSRKATVLIENKDDKPYPATFNLLVYGVTMAQHKQLCNFYHVENITTSAEVEVECDPSYPDPGNGKKLEARFVQSADSTFLSIPS